MTAATAPTDRAGRASSRRITGVPKPARRRRPLLVVAGLVLASLAAALVTALLNAATAMTLVWATGTDVSRGHPVEPQQLVGVEVSTSAAEPLVAATVESRDQLTGQVWAVDLPERQLLSPALVSERLTVAPGQALVGLRLEPGNFPVAGLRAGDAVMVIEATPQPGQPGSVLVDSAIVESVAILGDQGISAARLVTVAVPEDAAAAVASAASAGRASIAVVSP